MLSYGGFVFAWFSPVRFINPGAYAMIYRLILLVVFLLFIPHIAYAQQAGNMKYNFTTKQYQFFDGAQWYNLGLGVALGACTKEAAMDFEPLVITSYRYCNGTHWIRIVGVPTLSFCSRAGMMDFIGSTYRVCNGLVWTNIKGLPAGV